ncbi:MAG: hypothetical protein KDA99_04200, partial [Planctomycetales bacterium]|nr:hypothetical protein [Planctomycetales bacterium]
MFAPSSVALLLSALNVFAGAVATVDSPLQLEEPPAKMQEVGVRTAKDIRRTEAALQFAQGRMAFHREKHADALRHYQRAWRLDPQKSILREIVTLATAIEHDTIAARYALLDPPAIDDAPLLRHLARFVINNEQAEDAITLFEASQQLDHQPPKGLEPIYTALQMGRIYFLHDRWDAATEQFHIYVSALQDPDKFGLNDEALRFLKEDEALNLALAGEAFLSAKRWDAAQSAFAMI